MPFKRVWELNRPDQKYMVIGVVGAVLAGAMPRRLLWTLWKEELSPRDTVLRSLKWNHMIFGMGQKFRGLNEKL